MVGWKIFARALRLIVDNLGAALRVTVVPMTLVVVAGVLIGGPALQTVVNPQGVAQLTPTDMSGLAGRLLPFYAVALAAYAWAAIGWHRFVLLGEDGGWIPDLRGGRLLGYVGRALLLGLVMILVAVALFLPGALVIGTLAAISEYLAALVGSVAYVAFVLFMIVLFYRLSPILPAAAVDRRLAFREAWDATSGSAGAMLLIAVLTFVLSLLAQIPTFLDAGIGGAPGAITLVYTLVTQWFFLLLGVAVLTTIYGHYVEGRPLE